MSSTHGLGLQVTMANGAKQKSGTVTDDPDFVRKLSDECCSGCRPHPSYYSGSGMAPPPGHLPWDEVEMRKHDLLNSHCKHFQAVPPGDEQRIRSKQCLYPAQMIPGGEKRPSRITIKVDNDESISEDTHGVESPIWEAVEEAPLLQCVEDTEIINRNLTVKRLTGGGRLIVAKNNKGCELRLLETVDGDRLAMATRCRGPEGASVAAAISSPRSSMPTDVPPLALTSTRNDETKAPSVSAPPTSACLNREPMAFDSIVAESEANPPTRADSVELPDSVASEAHPKETPKNSSVSTTPNDKVVQSVARKMSSQRKLAKAPSVKKKQQRSDKGGRGKGGTNVVFNLRVSRRR